MVPGAGDDVQIVVDAAVTITIDQDITVNSIKLGAGGTVAKKDTLILDTDRTLTVTGNFTWDKVGVFEQNAGSSVTAANYVFGTSGSGYSMAVWNIYGTSGNRASVHGAGNIVAAAPTLPPVQQVDWQYADFDITGYTAISLKNAWDSNAYSSLNIDHCYFNGTGYVDIGQYAPSSINISVTNSDFRNTTSVLPGINSQVTIRNYTLPGVVGNFSFSGNTFSGNSMGKVYVYTVGNNRELKNNVFYNRSLDLAYLTSLPTAQKTLKVYNNVFYTDASAGAVNGQLVDYGGGIEIYDNFFIGVPYNNHAIQFPAGYLSDLPKTIIRNNVFDMVDGDSDVINLNYVPVDILNNIFINSGTPINIGVSGGGGGSLSPNSGYVNILNNTSYLTDTVASMVWAGETSQHTGGPVIVKNNLIGGNYQGTSVSYKDSQSTVDAFDYIDYSWFYPDIGATLTKYQGILITGKTEGDVGFGAYDQTGDPQFFDKTRLSTTYDSSLGGNGTTDHLVSEILKRNQNVSGETWIAGYSVTGALDYVRQGFTPTNESLLIAGDNTYVGAISFTVKPTVTAQSASSINTTTATLNGTITFSGNASSTIRGFNYGLTSSYGSTDSTTGSYDEGAFSQGITGLTCGTTYHYQAFALNSAGLGTSPDQTFTTSDCPILPSNNTVTITFKTIPTYATATPTPLKYNKNFAFSYSFDDGLDDGYDPAFTYMNGGYSNYIGQYFGGLYFTDGAGNNVPFRGGYAFYTRNASYNDLHINTPSYITWPQLQTAVDNGWDVMNHGYTSATIPEDDPNHVYYIGDPG